MAYPENADNPITQLINTLKVLNEKKLDDEIVFQPSNLEITTIDVNNNVTNMIPQSASASFNIRFNDEHNSESLTKWIKEVCEATAKNHKLDIIVRENLFSEPGKLSNIIVKSINDELGVEPILSTNGGTSDGRFIKDFSNVAEFGLIGKTMHKFNENISINDIRSLSIIYFNIIEKYFD